VRSVELLQILALAALPMTLERIYFTVLRIRGRLRELTIWRAALTAVLLVASSLLIPTGGLEVIGWVWLVTHAVAAVAIVAFRSELWLGR
jgi:O-antigen/teichoic acid export membrane protein